MPVSGRDVGRRWAATRSVPLTRKGTYMHSHAIPDTMRAAAIDRFGGAEELTIHELPVPVPGPGEVLLALHTAEVGPWDADVRSGWYPGGRPSFPLVLGTYGA